MRVLFASFHCCIRVVKMYSALTKAGIEIDFIHSRVANADFENLPRQTRFTAEETANPNPEDYIKQLARITSETKYDLIHVHNEPDWLGHLTKQVCPSIPVVFDAHDLDSLRQNHAPGEDEVKTFQTCDAFIFPSLPYMIRAMEQNGCTKPAAVVMSMCTQEMIGLQDLPRKNGLVYQGTLTAKHPHRNYGALGLELSRAGIPCSMYPSNGDVDAINAHGAAGFCIETPVDYSTLLRQLSRYDWGFIGCGDKNDAQWNMAMPNKLFEYLAAGIPVIVYGAAEVARFVKEHELGVVIEDLGHIASMYEKKCGVMVCQAAEAYRQIVRAKRRQFTMESQTETILRIYREAVKSYAQAA